MDVIHDRAGSYETLCAEEFFGIQGSVWATKLGVAFLGKFSHRHVIRHRKSTSFFPSLTVVNHRSGEGVATVLNHPNHSTCPFKCEYRSLVLSGNVRRIQDVWRGLVYKSDTKQEHAKVCVPELALAILA